MPKLFTKKVIQPRTYWPRDEQGKPYRLEISPERIEHWAKETNRLIANGNNVPLPYVHTDEAVPVLKRDPKPGSYNNGGYLNELKVGEDGWLEAVIEAGTEEDAAKIGDSIRDVSLRAKDWVDGGGEKYTDVLTHLALVNHPIVRGQPNFVPHEGIALSVWMADQPTDYPTDDPAASKNAFETLLGLLAECGFELPDGTDELNFVDRLTAALTAIKSYKDTNEGGDAGRLERPPAGAKQQQPAPLAMSNELTFALEIVKKSPNNPVTGQPWTADELSTAFKSQKAAPEETQEVQLSAELQHNLKMPLMQRIENLVSKKILSPTAAQELVIPELNQMEVQLSGEGKIDFSDSKVSFLLDVLEKNTPGSVLTGQDSVSLVKKTQTDKGLEFSLGDGLQQLEQPEEWNKEPTDDWQHAESDPEEQKALAERMAALVD